MTTELPTELQTEPRKQDNIASAAAITLQETNPPEAEKCLISFANYIEDKCCVGNLKRNNAQGAVSIIKDVGLNFRNHGGLQDKFTIKPVHNSPPYGEFYRKLPKEIIEGEEVKEIIYTHEKKEIDLRIFYYAITDAPHPVFYLLAISDVHENLDHRTFESKKFASNRHSRKKRRW